MNNKPSFNTDYEDMDDLQLSERIGWGDIMDKEIIPDDLDAEPADYDTEYGNLNFDQKSDNL